MITGATRVYGLLGRPTRHSASPALHNAWFAEHGLDAVYVAFEVPPDVQPEPVSWMRGLSLAGLNLTVPFKAAVLDRCDRLDPVARVAGAVNVLVADGGEVAGFNTDAEGFTRAFEADHGALSGRRAAVLGAGGAGRAVAAGLCARGAASVHLANRTQGPARDAAARLGQAWPQVDVTAGALESAAFDEADLVVVATSAGGLDAVGSLDVHRLPDHAVWCDLNYWHPDPPGLAAARRRGLDTLPGLPMLVHQAALAFALWTGERPDTDRALRRLRGLS